MLSLEDEYMALLNSWDCLSLWLLLRTISQEEQTDLYNSFPKGKKVKYKQLHTAMEKAGRIVADVVAFEIDLMAAAGDGGGVSEYLEIDGVMFILDLCDASTVDYIKGEIWITEF